MTWLRNGIVQPDTGFTVGDINYPAGWIANNSQVERDKLNITIAATPSKGSASNVVVTSSGEYLIYQAPTSGSSDTITYTVSDGVNTSTSAANIVITLT